jgi:hypothetical protein
MSDDTSAKTVNEHPQTGTEATNEAGVTTTRFQPGTLSTAPTPTLTDARDPNPNSGKYRHTDEKLERDAIVAKFAPLRATIVHAGNGDRAALASALSQLADLHQRPVAEDSPADHLRAAGAAIESGRNATAASALVAAHALLPAGMAADKTAAAEAALTAGDPEAALKLIDEALADECG